MTTTMTAAGALPNLLVAGVPKGGTTSLFRWLSQHPDVCASRIKELRYFDPVRYGEPLAAPETYAQRFAHWSGERYRMEGTPGYFSGGEAVATAVQDVCGPDVRVLVSLRDPTLRCWSWYRFVRGRAQIPKDMDFDRYLDICERQRSDGTDALRENRPYYGLRAGCYDEWIDAWQDRFGDRFRVIFFDDLASDPRRVVDTTLRWLDLDDRMTEAFDLGVENRSVQYRSRSLLQAALVLNRRAETFFEQHRGLKRALRRVYHGINRSPAPERLEHAHRERLAAFYEPHIARLAGRLHATLADEWPDWLASARNVGADPDSLPELPVPRPERTSLRGV
jgi:hypothetical protein